MALTFEEHDSARLLDNVLDYSADDFGMDEEEFEDFKQYIDTDVTVLYCDCLVDEDEPVNYWSIKTYDGMRFDAISELHLDKNPC